MDPADEGSHMDPGRTDGEVMETTHKRPGAGKRRRSEDSPELREHMQRQDDDYKTIVECMATLIRKYASKSSNALHTSGIPFIVSGYDLAFHAVTEGRALLLLMAPWTGTVNVDELTMLSDMTHHLASECRARDLLYAFIDMSAADLGALANLPPSTILCLTGANDDDRLELAGLKSMMQALETRSEHAADIQRVLVPNELEASESMQSSSHDSLRTCTLPMQGSLQPLMETTQMNTGLELSDFYKTSTESLDQSYKSGVLDYSTKKRLSLEEQIKTHEAILQSLKVRQAAINKALKRELVRRNNGRADVVRLNAHEQELQIMRQTQKELCDRYHCSFTENRWRLKSLLDGIDLTAGEMAELLKTDVGVFLALNEIDDVDDAGCAIPSKGSVSESSIPDASIPTVFLDSSIETPDVPQRMAAQENYVYRPTHPAESPEMLRRFWQLNGKCNRVILFLPMLPASAVRRIMDFSIKDAAATVRDPAVCAKQRRHAMCFTCLDFQQLRIYKEPQRVEHCLSLVMNNQGLGTNFDPYIAICPYELGGSCVDRFCPFQHVKPREQESILPRELLSLPPLKPIDCITPEYGKKLKKSNLHRCSIPSDMNLKSKGPDGTSKLSDSSIELSRKTVGMEASGIEDSETLPFEGIAHPASSTSFSGSGEDFLRLPSPDASDYSSDGAEGGNETSGAVAPLQCLSLVSADSSVEVVLKEMLLRLENTAMTSLASIFQSLTLVLDFVRLAIHSGRFDFCESLKKIFSKKLQSISASNCLGSYRLLLERIWNEITEIVDKAFVPNACECRDIFSLLFDVQLTLNNLSILAGLFHFHVTRSSSLPLLPETEIWLCEAMGLLDKLADAESHAAWSSEAMAPTIFNEIFSVLMNAKNSSKARVSNVLDWLNTCRKTIKSVHLDSMPSLIDRAWSHASSLLTLSRSSTDHQYSWARICVLSSVASILFDALCRLASPMTSLNHKLEVPNSVIKILRDLRDDAEELYLIDLLLSPILAASIATMCALKQYAQAHQLLESYIIQTGSSGFLHLSELLWSQMVHLRLTFPPSSAHPKNFRNAFVKHNGLIIDRLDSLGVKLHHVVLRGDWNLVACVNRRPLTVKNHEVADTCIKILQDLVLPNKGKTSIDINLDGCCFAQRCNGSDLLHEFPTSILLIGASVKVLSLSYCEMKMLPSDFGSRFPNLETLSLGNNLLSSLPSSFHLLQKLRKVDLASNKLKKLPPLFVFPHLEELVLSHNSLNRLPMSMKACKSLQVLLVDGNDLDTSLLMIASDLPKLRFISPGFGRVDSL